MTETPPLSSDEIERYARHIVMPEIGGPGQQRLKAAHVAIVGAGGLGSPVALYLTAAGVGQLTIIDDDDVAVSNLQRQILHTTGATGRNKAANAAHALGDLNPHVTINAIAKRLTAANADEVLSGAAVVIDGSDNARTRYLIADWCAANRVPLVTGSLYRFEGNLTVLAPWQLQVDANGDGRAMPAIRDIFPDMPEDGTLPSCAEAGILGPVAGVIGSLQAIEAIKVITGIGTPLIGELLLYDSLAVRFTAIRVASAP
ncbi:MAG: molybdopterin-synthase adenylyltransferase MoeB [Pseudomonadota bacterium]